MLQSLHGGYEFLINTKNIEIENNIIKTENNEKVLRKEVGYAVDMKLDTTKTKNLSSISNIKQTQQLCFHLCSKEISLINHLQILLSGIIIT